MSEPDEKTVQMDREAQAWSPRTALGRELWEIRKEIVASGVPLLDWDELEKEIADRRGGSDMDSDEANVRLQCIHSARGAAEGCVPPTRTRTEVLQRLLSARFSVGCFT